MKKALFVISAFAMATPFILEFLLFAGVLKEYGSTIKDRQSAYAILMYAGLAGMIVIVAVKLLVPRRKV